MVDDADFRELLFWAIFIAGVVALAFSIGTSFVDEGHSKPKTAIQNHDGDGDRRPENAGGQELRPFNR
jgi:hypothetical protein